jgi:hypothetical protein
VDEVKGGGSSLRIGPCSSAWLVEGAARAAAPVARGASVVGRGGTTSTVERVHKAQDGVKISSLQ